MKKLFLTASLIALMPAITATAATHHKNKTQSKHKTTVKKADAVPYYEMYPHMNIHVPAEALKEDSKPNSASIGVYGNLNFQSQDTSNDFTGKGYDKFSVGLIDLLAKARLFDWVNLNAEGSYVQTPDTGHTSNKFSLEQAYATIGNLYKTPFYLSVGYQYLPFGVYEPYSISSSVTKQLDEAHNMIYGLGYETHNFYSMFYFYGTQGKINGNSQSISPQDENFGAEAGYVWKNLVSGLHVNASYINNFREVTVIRDLTPQNLNRVGAFSAHASYYYGIFGVMGDYTFATNEFNRASLSYDGSNAQPSAIYGQAYVRFNTFSKPSAFALGYGYSWDALALQIPESRFTADYSFLLNQYLSLEFQYSLASDYSTSDTANMNRDGTIAVINGTGKNSNAFQVRLSYGFGNEHPDLYDELESHQ